VNVFVVSLENDTEVALRVPPPLLSESVTAPVNGPLAVKVYVTVAVAPITSAPVKVTDDAVLVNAKPEPVGVAQFVVFVGVKFALIVDVPVTLGV